MTETLLRLKHRHGQSWQEMDDITERRGVAATDPEREWSSHRIFRCEACAEEILVEMPAGPEVRHGG